MTNGTWIQEGDTTTHLAPYNSTSPVGGVTGTCVGDGVKIGTLFGVCVAIPNQATVAAQNETIEVRHVDVHKINKLATDVVTDGLQLYWDDTNRRVTITATGNLFIGHAIGAFGNGVAYAYVRLNNASKAVG